MMWNGKRLKNWKGRLGLLLALWAMFNIVSFGCIGSSSSYGGGGAAPQQDKEEADPTPPPPAPAPPKYNESYGGSWTPEKSKHADDTAGGMGVRSGSVPAHNDDSGGTTTVLKGAVAGGAKILKVGGAGYVTDAADKLSTAAGQVAGGDTEGAAKTWGKWFISTLGGVITAAGATAATAGTAPGWVPTLIVAGAGYAGYKATSWGLSKLPGDPFGYHDNDPKPTMRDQTSTIRNATKPTAVPGMGFCKDGR